MFPINESIDRNLLHNWAIGLLLFQSWVRIITIQGMNEYWRRQFDWVQEQGIMQVNVEMVVKNIVVPILGYLMTSLAVPNVLVYGVVPMVISNVQLQMICQRFIYTFVAFQGIAMIGFYYGVKGIAKLYPIVKQSILDDKYLIGHRLRNVDEM